MQRLKAARSGLVKWSENPVQFCHRRGLPCPPETVPSRNRVRLGDRLPENFTERLKDLRRILIDQTGVGEVFVEEVVKSGLKNAQGIMLSLPAKQEVMFYLKLLMQNEQVHTPYDRELINELNVERYAMTKTGQVQFSHPTGHMMTNSGPLPLPSMRRCPRSLSIIRWA